MKFVLRDRKKQDEIEFWLEQPSEGVVRLVCGLPGQTLYRPVVQITSIGTLDVFEEGDPPTMGLQFDDHGRLQITSTGIKHE